MVKTIGNVKYTRMLKWQETMTDLIRDLNGFGTVWHHPKGIANILSLSWLRKHRFDVKFDISAENSLKVKKHNSTTRIFRESD